MAKQLKAQDVRHLQKILALHCHHLPAPAFDAILTLFLEYHQRKDKRAKEEEDQVKMLKAEKNAKDAIEAAQIADLQVLYNEFTAAQGGMKTESDYDCIDRVALFQNGRHVFHSLVRRASPHSHATAPCQTSPRAEARHPRPPELPAHGEITEAGYTGAQEARRRDRQGEEAIPPVHIVDSPSQGRSARRTPTQAIGSQAYGASALPPRERQPRIEPVRNLAALLRRSSAPPQIFVHRLVAPVLRQHLRTSSAADITGTPPARV
ncbi:hypothetical protein C8J57DRAFT_1622204 [Mycena rebaudengoi]|nr:hypothetical protein C8J57DRAFT_1622204 [Mycena rebaudengoi]